MDCVVKTKEGNDEIINQLKKFIFGNDYVLSQTKYWNILRQNFLIHPVRDSLTVEQQQELIFQMYQRLVQCDIFDLDETNLTRQRALNACLVLLNLPLAVTVLVQQWAFYHSIKRICPNRSTEILNMMRNSKIFGCFAMTEMSLGTYPRRILTACTYDPCSSKLTLHTPEKANTKVWLGAVGPRTTHCLVFARLVVMPSKVNLGLQPFLITLRDPANKKLSSGVQLGSMGLKAGQNAVSHGYMAFDNMQIEIDCLLNQYIKLDSGLADRLIARNIEQERRMQTLTMSTIHVGRVWLVDCSSLLAAKALKITFFAKPLVDQLSIDELTPIEMIKLVLCLSRCYALFIFARSLNDEIIYIFDDNTIVNHLPKSTSYTLDTILIAAAKAWSTNLALDIVMECMKITMSSESLMALARLRDDLDPMLTYEGDNNVLLQHTAKFLATEFVKNPSKQAVDSSPKKDIGLREDIDITSIYQQLQLYLTEKISQCTSIRGRGNWSASSTVDNSYAYWSKTLAVIFVERKCIKWFRDMVASLDCPLQQTLSKICDLFCLTSLQAHSKILVAANLIDNESDFLLNSQSKIESIIASTVDRLNIFINAILPPNDDASTFDDKMPQRLAQRSSKL